MHTHAAKPQSGEAVSAMIHNTAQHSKTRPLRRFTASRLRDVCVPSVLIVPIAIITASTLG